MRDKSDSASLELSCSPWLINQPKYLVLWFVGLRDRFPGGESPKVKMPGSAVALILIVVAKPNRAFSTTMQQKFNYFERQIYKGQVLWVI